MSTVTRSDEVITKSDKLILISAWNESGGGFTHRLFDGHPQCLVYPFEMQLGTNYNSDKFCRWFSSKYRWPSWDKPLETMSSVEIFDSIQDQEVKQYLRNPASNKFQDFNFQVSLDLWKSRFCLYLKKYKHVDRRNIIESYLLSLFDSWVNYKVSGREKYILGHCPTLVLDFDKVKNDFPESKMIHVVRSPYTGFVDFNKWRPNISLTSYCHKWSLVNSVAFFYSQKYPENLKLVKYEDILSNTRVSLMTICTWLGLNYYTILEKPTWNSEALDRIQPFGGVQSISSGYEYDCLKLLTPEQIYSIKQYTECTLSLIEDSSICETLSIQ